MPLKFNVKAYSPDGYFRTYNNITIDEIDMMLLCMVDYKLNIEVN